MPSDVRGEVAERVVLIDDEVEICDMVTRSMVRHGIEVFAAHAGREGLDLLRRTACDIVLLDVMLPDYDGFELAKAIMAEFDLPIIFLTARTEEGDKVLGLGLGDDYVTKPFSPRELAARIRTVLRRGGRQAPQLVTDGMRLDVEGGTVTVGGRAVDLTAKEFAVLRYLMENRGILLSKDQIYSACWGDEFLGDDNTVMVHIHRLRTKLARHGGVLPVTTVKGMGYRLEARRARP